jgi:hypothetical protein
MQKIIGGNREEARVNSGGRKSSRTLKYLGKKTSFIALKTIRLGSFSGTSVQIPVNLDLGPDTSQTYL